MPVEQRKLIFSVHTTTLHSGAEGMFAFVVFLVEKKQCKCHSDRHVSARTHVKVHIFLMSFRGFYLHGVV